MNPAEILAKMGLTDRADHFPNRLSGGEQQRIAIARALCKNPDLLLCDEPTGALDSATGVQVLKLLEEFCREYKKTVVIITHNQDIAKIADRVFFFRDGQIDRIEQNEHPIKPGEIIW
jgi:putative ABC transport system ATP-binding protein